MRILILATLFLAGCANPAVERYERSMQGWIGEPEQAVLQAWGAPSNVQYLNQTTKELTFTQVNYGSTRGGRSNSGEVYTPGVDAGYDQIRESQPYFCQTNFTIRKGRVIGYSYNGKDCIIRD